MPGWTDDGTFVTSALRRVLARLTSPSEHKARGRGTLVLALTAALALTGTGVAVAQAHKTITLDVDGQVREISTFAGSVAGVLEAEEISLENHDALTPLGPTALSDGDTIVVRHAHQVTVLTDGEQTTAWTTALSADEALQVLAARGDDVRLVATRSAGRVELPLRLSAAGEVSVVADGVARTVAGSTDLAEVLESAGVELTALDRVHVRTAGAGVEVVVQRVVVAEQSVVSEIAFETVTEQTGDLYRDQKRTVTSGVPGERTQVFEVTTVDGVETARELISDTVTAEPVTAVVEVGTKARPVVAATPVSGDVWAALARCESGGNPTIVSSNGLYYGLYQFSLGTWRSVGGSGLPTDASAAEQTARAQALQARSGWGQWPHCAAKLGLL